LETMPPLVPLPACAHTCTPAIVVPSVPQKWNKGKVREKLANAVLFDEKTYERLVAEVPKVGWPWRWFVCLEGGSRGTIPCPPPPPPARGQHRAAASCACVHSVLCGPIR
jgi:hypothetical protein